MDDTKKLIEKYKRELMELSKTTGNQTGAKAPQVIGYANGDKSEAYDEFLTQITGQRTETPRKEPDTKPQPVASPAPDLDDVFADMDNDPAIGEAKQRRDALHDSQTANSDMDEKLDYIPGDELLEPGAEIFGEPNFVTVPSVQQVQRESTEQGDSTDGDPKGTASGITDNSAVAERPDLADTSSTTKEAAERLGDTPISGTDPNEQLTGRSFEDERTPVNSPDNQERNGSQTKPIDYPDVTYENFEDFESKNIGRGAIVFRVYAARQAYPVSGVKCVISKKFGGKAYEIVSLTTDSSGQTRPVALPAPSRELSQNYENDIQPFALYDATVSKEGFAEVVLYDIPVFDGIQSVQRVSMIPIAMNGSLTEEITEVSDGNR